MSSTLRLPLLIGGVSLTVLLDQVAGYTSDEPPEEPTECAYAGGEYTAIFAVEGTYKCRFFDENDNERFVGYCVLTDGLVAEVFDRIGLIPSSVAQPIGARVVTITVIDDADAVVPGVRVTIQDDEGNAIAGASEPTNSSGVVSFNLNDGDYRAIISTGFGYTPHTAETFTVDSDGETATLTLTRNTTEAEPSAAGLCAVHCYVYRNGVPIEGAKVQAKLRKPNSAVSGIVLSTEYVSEETDENGLAVLELVRLDQFTDGDGVYQIDAFDGDQRIWSTKTTVPNASSSTLEAMFEQ